MDLIVRALYLFICSRMRSGTAKTLPALPKKVSLNFALYIFSVSSLIRYMVVSSFFAGKV